jgi:hypothetical protein
MNGRRTANWIGPLLAVLIGATLLAGCVTAVQRPVDDASGAITHTLKAAFQTLPDALFNQDLSTFDAFLATPAQGADPRGLRNLHQWIDEFQRAGKLPESAVTYELVAVDVSQVEVKGQTATAHVRVDLSKVGAGDQPTAAFVVNQNIALQHMDNDKWLIIGADQAHVDRKAAPVK